MALGHSSQCFFKLHGQLLIVVISLWNSGATKNYKNSRLGRTYQSQFRVFFYVVELALILQCNGEVLTCFWPFAELLKCIRWTEIYFKHKNRLILFWLMKFLGWSFGRLNRYTSLQNRLATALIVKVGWGMEIKHSLFLKTT